MKRPARIFALVLVAVVTALFVAAAWINGHNSPSDKLVITGLVLLFAGVLVGACFA